MGRPDSFAGVWTSYRRHFPVPPSWMIPLKLAEPEMTSFKTLRGLGVGDFLLPIATFHDTIQDAGTGNDVI